MKKILFVCVENAGSQMAEALFRKYTSDKFDVSSAGTKPAVKVNPLVVQEMNEISIDVGSKVPAQLSNDMLEDSIIINMGCMDKESCPALFGQNVLDWAIQDPKGKSLDDIRDIRNQIEIKVKKLIKSLE